MDLFLVNYNQEKKENKGQHTSKCNIKLYQNQNVLTIIASFSSNYNKYSGLRYITFDHQLDINIDTGDFTITYRINNDDAVPSNIFKSTTKTKNNDFEMLDNLIIHGLIRGEKKKNFWGVKYDTIINNLVVKVYEILNKSIQNEYYKTKKYLYPDELGNFYEFIVDYHLDRKNIKSFNGVYEMIKSYYPKQKWLKKNEYKFLPSVLDEYGIKSKYLIGKMNREDGGFTEIRSLKYLCNLFGEDYIEFIKKFDWEPLCYIKVSNKRIHILKNKSEKESLVKLINDYNNKLDSIVATDSLINQINRLLTLREELEKIGYDLKFNFKKFDDLQFTLEFWESLKVYHNRGFKLRYKFPVDFVKSIEKKITTNGLIFKPKLLVTEDDFRIEGFKMKNCMGKQFIIGVLCLFISLECEKTTINIQFKDGKMCLSYGKANTEIPSYFKNAINILVERMKDFSNLKWEKERYSDI